MVVIGEYTKYYNVYPCINTRNSSWYRFVSTQSECLIMVSNTLCFIDFQSVEWTTIDIHLTMPFLHDIYSFDDHWNSLQITDNCSSTVHPIQSIVNSSYNLRHSFSPKQRIHFFCVVTFFPTFRVNFPSEFSPIRTFNFWVWNRLQLTNTDLISIDVHRYRPFFDCEYKHFSIFHWSLSLK